MDKCQKSTTHPHLIALDEASKQWEKHGGLCGFGVLSEILDHRAICLLKREDNIKCRKAFKSMRWGI